MVTNDLVGSTRCSATLIAPDLVLTAAHCIAAAGSRRFEITGADGTQTVRSFGVRTALAHPAFQPDVDASDAVDDIGMLVLDEAVPDDVATPQPLHRTALGEDVVGVEVTAVGYGATADLPAGTKRTVQLCVERLIDDSYVLTGLDPSELADNEEIGVVGLDGGLCPGDSGGPDLIDDDGVLAVVGVHALGSPTCFAAQSTRIDTHLDDFIDPLLEGRVPDGCDGNDLDDAVCNPALESGGCGCTQTSSALPLSATLASLALLGRRRAPRRNCR
ncbi:MAG TPA: trypsin-like serine protease [Myxococcota bacterium]